MKMKFKFKLKFGLRTERYGGGLAGAEAVEGAAEFGIAGGEAGGGKEGGVDLTGLTGGKEGA